jgi:hypothetical protein
MTVFRDVGCNYQHSVAPEGPVPDDVVLDVELNVPALAISATKIVRMAG